MVWNRMRYFNIPNFANVYSGNWIFLLKKPVLYHVMIRVVRSIFSQVVLEAQMIL